MSWLQDYLSQSNKAWDAENQRIGDSYVPDEHTNFIDSFQSGVWGSLAGGAGFLAAGAEKAGFTGLRDWAENEAAYAGKKAYANADKTEYSDLGWYDPRYYINGHALNDTAQMIGGSLVDIGLVAGSLLAAPETGGASLAGIAAVGAARTGGRIMGEKLLGNVLTKYALEKGATMGLEAGAKLASRQVLGEAALGTAKGLVNDVPFILTKGASESAINAGDVYMESLQMGNDRDTASSQSMQAFGEGYIPAMAEFYADKMAIGGTLAGFATKGGKVLSKAVRGAVANGVVSGQMEGAVEAWQTMVQDRALGKEDALNASIYDPTSWSDNMVDAYGQAVGPAMLLGGIGGARAGISSAMNNPNPDVEVTPEVAEQPVSIEGDITPVADSITPIEEGVAPIEGEISSAPVADLGGMDSTSPRQGLYDEMRNTFIQNNPESPDVVEAKSQATNDKIEDIVNLWDNSSPEEVQNLAPNTFVEDFKQAGLTDAEAGRASNGLVKHMKEQKPLPKVDGKALIEEASKVGVQLDPKQAENLVSENPSPALIKQVQGRINKARPIAEKEQAKLDSKREQEAIAQQQEEYFENEKRNYVDNAYGDSINKQFFDRVIGNTESEPNKAAETAYKFKRAMKERNKDIKNGESKAKNVRNYLAKQGITEEKYGKGTVQAMVDYTKAMDEERVNAQSISNPVEQKKALKANAQNITNIMAINKMHSDALKNAHGDKIQSVGRDIDNSLIQLGQSGFDITKLEQYKKLESAAKGSNKVATERLQHINEKVGLAAPIKEEKAVENKPIETKAEDALKENIESDGNGETKLTTKPVLSYTNLSNNVSQEGILKGRVETIKEAIESSGQGEITFTVEKDADISALQPILDDLYGKDKYKVETETIEERKEVYVVNKDTVVNEDTKKELRESSLYQRGEEDSARNANVVATSNDVNAIKEVFKRAPKELRLNDKQIHELTTSLLYWLGRENFPKAVEYLQKATYLKVNVETGHKPENGYTSVEYGVMRLKPENITATSSTLVHELVHDVVANILESNNTLSNNYIKGLFNDMPEKARGRKNEREQREAMEKLVSGGTGAGVRDLRALPTGDSGDTGRGRNQSNFGTNAGENRLDWTNDNSQNGLGVPSRSNSNGSSPDVSRGPGVRDSSLGSNRLDKTGTKNGEGLSEGQEERKVLDNRRRVDRGWVNAQNFIEKSTKEDVFSGDAFTFIQEKLDKLFDDRDLYMSDKAELIGAWLNAALQLDKKHGTNLLEQLRNDELILQETLAYASHTFMTPSQLGVIFDSGTKVMNVEKRQAVINDPFKKIIFVHRMGGTGRAKMKADWRTNEMATTKSLFNISAAATPLDKLMDPSLDKYGQALIVVNPRALDKLAYFSGTYDLRSIVDRKYKALRGKYGEEKVKEIINEFFNRGIVNGKGSLGQISLAMFSDISISKEDLKQNLIYRQRKEITPAQMAEFENRIGHMVSDLYVKYSNDNKAKYLREKGLPYDKVEKLILDTATYRRDKDTGQLLYSEKKGPGKTIISQSFFSGVMNAFRGYAENKNDANISEMFKKYSGINSVPDGLVKDLEKIANYMNEFQTTYAEVKFSEDLPANLIHGVYDPKGVLTPEQVKVFRDAGIRVIRNFKGMTVAEYIAKEKKSPLYQHGKEDPNDIVSNPAEASANMAEKLIEKEIKEETGRIEVHRRKDNKDNIPMYALLKELRSPSSLAKKHFPELVKFIEDARQVVRKTGRDLKEYRTKMDAVYKQLKNKGDQKSFDKLKVEISDRRMEFAQVIPITMQDGTNKYTIIKEGDVFEEFEDESDALQKKVELEHAGYKVAKDYKNQRHRIFASKDMVRGYNSLEQANQIAIKESGEIAKSKGYNDTVWKAYVEYRKVLDELMIKAANANERVGNPDKQKYLWGYSPFEHSRFGVYEEQKSFGEDGKEQITRNVVASFRTERAARKWVEENLLNNPQFTNSKFAIVEQDRNYNNPRNDFDTHYATIDNDYFKDHVVEDFMTEEQKEAEFKRLTGLYPQMKKLVDSGFLTKPMEQKEFLALINNKATMEKLGIDGKAIQDEMKHANAYELFKRNGKVTKKSLIEHFYTNTGSFANNKHNMTRVMGAKGSNPNLQRADYDYLISMVKHINNAEWYHKATTAYEHWFKDKYKANKSAGSMSNKQEMMHTLIRTVMGVPNHFDTRLNEVMNEIPGLGRFMTKNYGETWATDVVKRGMEVTALTKLGLLRPTAMFAQLGVMANIFTMTGFNKNFWTAQAAALRGNKNPKYKELFSHIGIGEDYQGVESDVFNDSKSIIHTTKIGKLLAKQMLLFEVGDNFTRRVAAIYAYEKALAQGKSKEDALSSADDFVQATNFDYTEIDSPGVFQRAGVVGKMLLQFKKYPVKQMEFINDFLSLMDLPENPSVADIEKAKKEKRMRLIRFLGSYVAMAGMLGMPMAGVADELAAWITGTKPSEAMKELMYEWAGKDDIKQALARGAIYGAPGVLGVDFTRNIGLGDVVPTDASELAGPTFGTISSMYNAIKYNQSAKNKLIGEIHAIAPFYTNLYQALGTGKMRDWKAGMDTRDYTIMERVVKGLGFRPIRESVDSDLANILYNKIKNTKDAKKASIYKYLDNPTISNIKEMERYGVTKKDIESTKKSLEADRLEKIASMVSDKNKSEAFEELRKTRDTFLDYTEEDDE